MSLTRSPVPGGRPSFGLGAGGEAALARDGNRHVSGRNSAFSRVILDRSRNQLTDRDKTRQPAMKDR